MTEYKLKSRKGIDDLKGIYAFVGNSQGDNNSTNDLNVYLMSDGWLSFVFDCELTQEAINKESEKRIKENEEYIESLKKEGKYGKEYEITLNVEHNSLLDESIMDNSKSSHSFVILDLNE